MNWIINTDGSCLDNNPAGGPGGLGVVAIYGDVEVRYKKGYKLTTNNRMEILAIIDALSQIEEPANVTVRTDSEYTINAVTKWIHGWIKKGWITADGSSVKNRDLFERLFALTNYHNVTFEKVKGHSGEYYNEICDQLAKEAAKNHPVLDDVGFIPGDRNAPPKQHPKFKFYRRK